MKTPLAAAVIGAGLILSAGTADAGYYKRHGYYGHSGHHGHYRHYRHRGHHGHHNGALVAAGIIGGAVLLGTLLSAPRYHHPPAPVYYGPPRAPVCEKDNVYRTLPDGRVQWGVRTRCY
jgi:hypothetical protein